MSQISFWENIGSEMENIQVIYKIKNSVLLLKKYLKINI